MVIAGNGKPQKQCTRKLAYYFYRIFVWQ